MDANAPQVLVFGDINVDVLARLSAPLAPHGDNLPDALGLELGGVGANTAVSLGKWGAGVRLLGCVGRDWLGEFALRHLTSHGVDVSAISRVERMTGMIFIPIDPDGRRTIIGSRSANERAPDRAQVDRCLDGVRWLHLVGYSLLSAETSAVVTHLVEQAQRFGVSISLDAGLAPSREAQASIKSLAPRLDALFLGTEEAEALTGRHGGAALDAAARLGARDVLVKRAENGCRFLQLGQWHDVPPFAVAAVDTTGAGDAFAAGFIQARLRGWSTEDGVLLANAMGAAAAATLGAGNAMPGPDEVARVLERDSAHSASARLLQLLREERRLAQPARL